MPFLLEFSGHDSHLAIEVLRYENEQAQNADDANWLVARATYTGGGITANVRLAITAMELADLRDRLAALVSGESSSADFDTMEEGVDLSVSVHSTGAVSVSGHLRTPALAKNSASFCFDSDLPSLARGREQLEAIVAAFPVRETEHTSR